MTNPWLDLPVSEPFVLSEDSTSILAFNRTAKPDTFVHLEILPEPFLGNPLAPVVVLLLNPGYSPEDKRYHGTDHFAKLSWQNLRHAGGQYPFYLLNPSIAATPGYQWWDDKLSWLIQSRGRESVAQKLLCVEYFPYHSLKFAHSKLRVPSQSYSVELVHGAIERSAVIVVMRSETLWTYAVPELNTYPHLYRLNSSQNVKISPNNCPNGYHEITKALGR